MCHESTSIALQESIGIGKASVTLDDVYNAQLLILAGQNPGTNHPRMLSALEIAKQRGAKIISINPLREAGLINFRNPPKPRGWSVTTAPGQIVEGFHYLHHPVNQRLRELVASGELGDVQQVDIELSIPGPPDSDPRWSLELAGGATMDLGCYVLHAARQLGRWLDQAPSVVSAEASLMKPEVDSAMWVEVAYAGGVRGRLRWDMNAAGREMVWTVVGTAGTAVVPAFAVPQMDNRIVVTRDGSTAEQTLGDQTSYTYQLAALADTLQTGAEFLIDVDDSVANAELIDEVYRRAGLSPRG